MSIQYMPVFVANRKRKEAMNVLHYPLSPLTSLIAQFFLFGDVTKNHWPRELRSVFSSFRRCCYLAGGKFLKREDIFSVIANWPFNAVEKELKDFLKEPDYLKLKRIHSIDEYTVQLHQQVMTLVADYVDTSINRDSDESVTEASERLIHLLVHKTHKP